MRPIVYVEASACQTCDTCAARRSCKPRALMQFEHGDLPMVEAVRCLGCLLCVPACPHGAIRRGDTQRASPSQ